jgi:predicted ATPase
MNCRFVLTGGPGAGKTTLLNALAERGFEIVPEAARQIMQQRVSEGLPPRPEAAAFARSILEIDIARYRAIRSESQPVFFDRSVLDALYMLDQAGTLTSTEAARLVGQYPYHPAVFVLPPWEGIYITDKERDQTFRESVQVFDALRDWYQRWGYRTLEVPMIDVESRVAFIIGASAASVTRGNE